MTRSSRMRNANASLPRFSGRYHTMVISLHRPSPQIPRPSSRSADICYDSAVHVINLSNQQVKKGAIDITWVFLLTVNMSLNVLLWAISYREVREKHTKEEVEEMINVALDVIDQCSERWPGTKNASQLYSVLGRACLQIYDTNDDPSDTSRITFTSPLLTTSDSPGPPEASLPAVAQNGTSFAQNQQRPVFTQPVFGYNVEAPAENMNVFNFDTNPFQQPTFRSNSIFENPSSEPGEGRRPSFGYFPPDFQQPSPGEPPVMGDPAEHPAMNTHHTQSPSHGLQLNQLPTPPDSNNAGSGGSFSPPTMSPGTAGSPTPKMTYNSPMPVGPGQQQQVPPAHIKYEQGADPIKYESPTTPNSHNVGTPQHTPQQLQHRTPTFTVPPLPQHVIDSQRQQQQRSLPPHSSVSDWFSSPPPFISPFSFNGMNNNNGFWDQAAVSNAAFSGLMGGGGGSGYEGGGNAGGPTSVPGGGPSGFGGPHGMPPGFGFHAQRHGSLTADQQMELMNMLETDGVGEINNFLGMDLSGLDGPPGPWN